jgi:hypothetical protein
VELLEVFLLVRPVAKLSHECARSLGQFSTSFYGPTGVFCRLRTAAQEVLVHFLENGRSG